MRYSLWFIGILLTVSAGCRPKATPAPASASASALDSAAYRAVIDELQRRDRMGPVPVAIEFLPLSREYDTPATRAWLNRELPTVSSGMFEDLQRIPTAGLTLRDYVISAPDAPWIDSTTLMSRRDVSTVRFGLRLSPLAYSADSSEAVVYAVVACGAVCGSADYFVLQRAGPLSWRVRKVVRRWTG